MTKIIDLSNYSRRLSAQQVADLQAAGFNGAIVQSIDPPAGYPEDVDAQQLAALKAGGIRYLEGYVYWWWGNTPDYLGPLLDTLADAGVQRCWIDVEDTRDHPLAERIAELRAAVAYVAARGFKVGIYTGRWYWQAYMGDTTDFAALPLWAAQYDGDESGAIVPFGGWVKAALKQYAGDTTVAGIPAVDLDVEVDDVRTRELDGAQTLAVFNDLAAHLDRVIHDDPGYAAEEVLDGYPAAPGTRVFIMQVPAGDIGPAVGQ